MGYQQFIDVSQSPDLETLKRRLVTFAETLEFGLVGAIVITDYPDRKSEYVMMNNAPVAFTEASTNTEDSNRDPVLTKLKLVNVPFVYNQSLYTEANAGDLWEEQAKYGYKTGIAVALHLPGGKHFMLGFDRSEPLPSKDEALTKMLAELQLMAVHAQDAAIRILTPKLISTASPRFTARELEVLKWTHAGKTAWEIGQILGISQYTVNYFMRAILKKLEVQSKHQAVLKALALGVI